MTERSRSRNVAVVAGCMAAMFATAPGQTFVLSTFNESLTRSLDVSATRLAAAYLVGTLLSAACLTRVGRVADGIGPRRMMMIASVGLALAGVALSSVAGIVTLTLAFFLLRVFGQGALSLSSSHALALRYEANLGAVEGLRGATISAAIALVPQLSIVLIAARGWRSAAVLLAIGAGAIGLLAATLLVDRDPPRRVQADRDGAEEDGSFTLAEARRTGSLWILLAALATVAGILTAVHFHLQPILATAGMDETQAARTFVSFAVAGLGATLAGGLLADRVRPSVLLALAMALLAVGTVVLGLSRGELTAHAGMAMHGIAHGIASATFAPTIARYFGRAHHGAIRGLSGSVGVAGSAAGPWVASALADLVGGFGRALAVLAVGTALVAASCAFLRRPAHPGGAG